MGVGAMSSGRCLCDLNLAPILGMLDHRFFCDQLETSFMTLRDPEKPPQCDLKFSRLTIRVRER